MTLFFVIVAAFIAAKAILYIIWLIVGLSDCASCGR